MALPQIYDPKLDAFRDVTQLDIDLLGEVAKAYGRIRDLIKRNEYAIAQRKMEQLEAVHKEYRQNIAKLQGKEKDK